MRRKRRDQSKDKVKEKADIAFLCLNSERRNSQFHSSCPIPALPDETRPDQETCDGTTACKPEVDSERIEKSKGEIFKSHAQEPEKEEDL